ncbi:MAG: chorismate lyase [Rhodocyclaceae bacterium]|nr:chorismate lyase [Rhodocyclaceae bacterium]
MPSPAADTFSPPARGWRAAAAPPAPPAALRGWLRDTASLTARIRARCGHFSVTVLSQRLARPLPDEAHALGISPARRAWLREVLLRADDVPVVYARSWHPIAPPARRMAAFFRSGHAPLGQILFAHPRIDRSPLKMRCIDARDARYHRALACARIAPESHPHPLWARHSRFAHPAGCAVLVCEIFLPAIACLAP